MKTDDVVNSPAQLFDSTEQKSRNGCALGVMAKAPVPGKVKTRLVPPFTNSEAATLGAYFLRDTINSIGRAIDAAPNANGVVVYAPADAASAFTDLLPDNFQLLAQRGASLGERLFNATEDLLACDFESVCLINADSPTLPCEYLSEAIARVSCAGDRVVLGQADDGGYYLIGLKLAHAQIFERIAWSTPQVLAQTIERAAEINLKVELLPAWYDVDDGASLEKLCAELFSTNRNDANDKQNAKHTRAYLSALIEREGCERICPGLIVAHSR